MVAVRKDGQKTRKSWSFGNCHNPIQNTTHFFHNPLSACCTLLYRQRLAGQRGTKRGFLIRIKPSQKNGLIVRMSVHFCGFQKMQNVRNGEYGLMSNICNLRFTKNSVQQRTAISGAQHPSVGHAHKHIRQPGECANSANPKMIRPSVYGLGIVT